MGNLKNQIIKLLFRASKHQFKASSSHNLCNGHSNAIKIIRNEHGNIFGGFTNISWASGGENGIHFKSDQGKTFIFLLHSDVFPSKSLTIWNHVWQEGGLYKYGVGHAKKESTS